jgi:hypothetical protein
MPAFFILFFPPPTVVHKFKRTHNQQETDESLTWAWWLEKLRSFLTLAS